MSFSKLINAVSLWWHAGHCWRLILAVYFFLVACAIGVDQLLPQLPSDITFEICSSSPSSPAAPPSSASSSATRGGGDEEDTAASTFIKAERVVSGVHFLSDRAEEDRADLLLPKSETGESEPEQVRKQVGCRIFHANSKKDAYLVYENSAISLDV